MTKTIDALVEALTLIRGKHGCGALTLPVADLDRVDAALALARAEQAEPVAEVREDKRSGKLFIATLGDAELEPGTKLYTTPPAAPVAKLEPLSEDELRAGFENWFSNQGAWPAAIERNTNGPYLLAVTQSAWVAWFNAGPAVTAAHNAKLGGAG